MSSASNPNDAEPTSNHDSGPDTGPDVAVGDCETCDEITMGRRKFLASTAVAAGAVATGAGTVSASMGTTPYNHSHDLAHDPWINGIVTVATHKPAFATLDYINNSGERTNLSEHGVVLAEADADQPNNPVTYRAGDVSHEEYLAFPRGATYDDDNDGSTDEVDVEWHDATHWTTTGATNGSISVSNAADDALTISTTSLAAGETVTATFDLSTVASTNASITDGMSRKFFQLVRDLNALPSAVTIEYAAVDSNGNEVAVRDDPSGDSANLDVLATAEADDVGSQVRVGELEQSLGVTLADIQRVEVRISASGSAADGDVTLHALNLERENQWSWGTREVTDSDGNVVTEEVRSPSGEISITDLSTIPAPFANAEIKDVVYDTELRGSALPDDQVHVRVTDAPSAYDRGKVVDVVHEFVWPSAYEISVEAGSAEVIGQLPNSRYLDAEVATAIQEITEWTDVEDSITWTNKSNQYSVDSQVELFATTTASDRTAVHHRTTHDSSQANALTSESSSDSSNPFVVVGTGGGGPNIDAALTAVFGLIGGLGVLFRKHLVGGLRAIFG